MSKWFFSGEIFNEDKKEYNDICKDFLRKIQKEGIDDKQIYDLLDGKDMKIYNNCDEINDTICTESYTKIYVDGFYYLSFNEKSKEVRLIISGIFVKND